MSDRQRREYSDEVRARCLAALNAGESPAAVSAQYNVPAATLRSWKARAAQAGATPLVSEDKRVRMGELLVDVSGRGRHRVAQTGSGGRRCRVPQKAVCR